VRIANPEVRVTQSGPLIVTQDKPFEIAPPPPIKIDPATLNGFGTDAKTPEGKVIRRKVTVFSTVEHGAGSVTTGWNYRDGTGGVPVRQYCYYSAANFDQSITRINIALDQIPLPNISGSIVPDLQGALAKCQWWKDET
jgi:hypothetical protein